MDSKSLEQRGLLRRTKIAVAASAGSGLPDIDRYGIWPDIEIRKLGVAAREAREWGVERKITHIVERVQPRAGELRRW